MTSTQPTGTVTFLLTDIEASTRLWEQHPQAMKSALAEHDAILARAIEINHGWIIKTTGDGAHAAFSNALDAAVAALSAQQEFLVPLEDLQLKVRMGVHTGEAEARAGDYYGTALNRAARLMSVAHGGQIILSNAAAELLRDQLPPGAALHDLGEHRLKDLSRSEHVFQLTSPGLADEFPPLKSIDAFPNNLPIQLTSFVGRETEIAEIRSLLAASRLITLTGSGGTGKTRLSLEVGTQELPAFSHGVWLLELAPLADPTLIIPALAQVFGLQELPYMSLVAQVTDYLRDKQLLLLLDNCEHLIDACAHLCDDLLRQCARLKIIASSREALGIAGETAYRIPSLEHAQSMRLFAERARAANGRFALTDTNSDAVDKICARLDGIPLAIELAAARARLLSPEQIAARLDDRFRLLVGGNRTALPRQQTLRALIDWSYDLLAEEEKSLLRTASVFVGGWTLDALEAVAETPDVLEHLDQLVNKSMVISEEHGSEMRFSMLETIRQYAREKLFDSGQGTWVRDRHFAYFDGLSELMWHAYRTGEQIYWRDRADDEVENLRAALEWGLENHPEEALHLAAIFCFASSWISNEAEGIALCGLAIERVRSLPPVEGDANIQRQRSIARALLAQGMFGLSQGNVHLVIQQLQEAIELSRASGDKLILGYSLEMYFTAAQFIEVPGASEAAQEGFFIFTQELHDKWGLGWAYLNMARIAANQHNLRDKQMYLDKLKLLVQDVPPSITVGLFYMGLGMDESHQGNYAAAKTHFEDGLNVFSRIRNKVFVRIMRSELGHIARHTGDLAQARIIYRETIKGFQDLGNRAAIAHQLECFGFLASAEEEPQQAVRLFSAAQALRERINSTRSDIEEGEYTQAVAKLQSLLAEAEFTALWAEGRLLSMEQAIQLALS